MIETGKFTSESQVDQIVTNIMNFMSDIEQFHVFRDKEMPTAKNLSGVVRVGMQFSNPIIEQKIDGIAKLYGAIKNFPEWQRSNKRTLLAIRPMFESIQTYIFK